MSHNFKVGDEVILLDNWNDSDIKHEYINKVFEVLYISATEYKGNDTFRIELTKKGMWAEPHEIRHVTPLEKAMK